MIWLNKMNRIIACLLLLACFFVTVSIMAVPKLKALIISQEEGFVDLTLNIVKAAQETDGTFVITALSTHEGKPVGFELRIKNKWKKSPIGETNSFFYFGEGEFHNIGQPTDGLISVLASLYKMRAKRSVRKIIPARIVGLANDPSELLNKSTRMKFFFDSDDENTESQVFINIEAKQNLIEFHEKDIEFRGPLLKSLTEKPAAK